MFKVDPTSKYRTYGAEDLPFIWHECGGCLYKPVGSGKKLWCTGCGDKFNLDFIKLAVRLEQIPFD